jgi:hypothetical protein
MKVKEIRARIADGLPVSFNGYDGKTYRAILIEYRRKIATVRYLVFSPTGIVRPVRAYIADLSRIEKRLPGF